jgi:hypothetical protein
MGKRTQGGDSQGGTRSSACDLGFDVRHVNSPRREKEDLFVADNELFHQAFDIRRGSGIIGAIAGTVVVLGLWRLFDHDKRSRRRLPVLTFGPTAAG